MKTFGAVVLALTLSTSAQVVPWTTRAGDNERTGWNSHETILNQANVGQLHTITTIPLCCDARGTEGQPLIVPQVATSQGAHDVMYVASMSNNVRAVDAHTGAGIWQVQLGTAITSSAQIDFHQINQHWGCLATPVAVPALGNLYLSCWVSQDGSGTPQSGRYEMYVLDMRDGHQVVPPVNLQGSDTSMWKQRTALLYVPTLGSKGTIFLAHGSVYETSGGLTGGVTAFDIAANTVTAQMPLPEGIWMGGQGLSADAQGYLYAVTANGPFDGVKDFGESLIKLRYTPTSAATQESHNGSAAAVTQSVPASLKVVSWWSPYCDAMRMGETWQSCDESDALPNTKLAGVSQPSREVKEARRPVGGGAMAVPTAKARVVHAKNRLGKPVDLVYPNIDAGAWSDEDLGAGGGALMEPLGLYIASGKDGIAYVARTANMGNTLPSDFANVAANCGKLATPPVWLAEDPGPVNACPADLTTLDFMPWGKTRHMHMTPVQFYNPLLKSWEIAVWGENSQLHLWEVTPSGTLTYLAQSNEVASANVTASPGGMPGGFCSGSSNGQAENSYLLVCAIPYGDANATVTNGRLLIYDPVHIQNGVVPVLYDSQVSSTTFLFNKFDPPFIDGGELIVPNYNGGVMLMGLTQ